MSENYIEGTKIWKQPYPDNKDCIYCQGGYPVDAVRFKVTLKNGEILSPICTVCLCEYPLEGDPASIEKMEDLNKVSENNCCIYCKQLIKDNDTTELKSSKGGIKVIHNNCLNELKEKEKEGNSEKEQVRANAVNFKKDKIIFTLDITGNELEGYEDALETNNPVYLGGTSLAPLLRQLANLTNSKELGAMLNELGERAEEEDFD